MSRSRSSSRTRSRSRGGKNARQQETKNNRIWVGGLDDETSEKELEDQFKKFGKIVDIKLRTNRSDIFAFIEFEENEHAQDAIERMDQSRLKCGNKVKVNWATHKTSTPRKNNDVHGGRYQVWIGKLHDETAERTVRKRFEEFGDIVSMQLRRKENETFCFVEYKNKDTCERAIRDMHDRDFDGSRIIVDWSRRNQVAMRGSRSGRGGNARRRSRSYEIHSSRSRSPGRRRGGPQKGKYKFELENLPKEMTWMDLKNLASKLRGGDDVTFARTFHDDGIPCGLLEFASRESMNQVRKQIDGKRINGHKIKVTML